MTNYASPGAVNQKGGNLPVKVCNRCHDEIVWVTSQRTGKAYPVDVSHGYHGQRFYIGRNVHKCAERIAQRDANIEADRLRTKRLAAIADIQGRYRAGTITKADYLAAIEGID